MARIWLGEPERSGALEIRPPFDDPWLNFGAIVSVPPGRAAQVLSPAWVTKPSTSRPVAA